MNKKGFTLVELLVTIAILGIITGLSVPLIRNIQSTQINRKYEVYLDTVVSSAKLYVDSYGVDVFGHAPSACKYITYSEMKEKNLIKDFKDPNVSCDSDYTRVKVVKFQDRYFYKAYLGCGKGNGHITPTIFKPEGASTEAACDKESPFRITFSSNIADSEFGSNFFKQRKMKIYMDSPTGIATGVTPNIEYAIMKTRSTTSPIDNWKPLNGWAIPGKTAQMNKITKGENVRVASDEITVPINEYSGNFYVVLKVNSLKDLNMSNWTVEGNEPYYYIGPFKVDNTKPVLSPSVNNKWVVSQSSVYNTTTPKLNLIVTDNSSNESQLRYCYSYTSHADCPIPKDINDTAKLNKYTVYKNNNKVNMRAISSSYNGRTYTVYLTVIDRAMNNIQTTMNYRVAQEYKLTLNANGGTICNPKIITKKENENWGSICTPTKAGNSFVEWNTKANGTGTKVASSTKVTANLTAYAKWRTGTYKITYNANGGTGTTAQTTCTYNTNCALRANGFSRTGYAFDGWYTAASSGTKYGSTTKLTSNITVYAHWKPRTYTVSYAGGGATGGETASSTCAYNQSISPRANGFSRTGYTFNGWSGIPAKCTGNVTLTATWKINTYKITYNGNGNTSGSTAQTSCSYNTNCSLRGNGFVKKGYTFTGWYTATSGGTKYGSTTRLTGNKTVYAHWRSNYVNIQYHVNGGTWASPHGTAYSISNSLVYKRVNGTNTAQFHKRYYDGGGQADPLNATNPNHINLKRSGKRLTTNAQWKCATSAKCGTKTYNQDTSYSAKNYCSTIESGDCTITLKANWR